jgi:hypothetical protein
VGEPPPPAAGDAAAAAPASTAPASASPAGAASQAAEPTVTLTARDGSVTTVYGDDFRHRQTARQLHLRGGQIIAFDRISSIDVIRVSQDQARVNIKLVDGRTVEGSINAGLYPFGFTGQNDLGPFGISVSDLARITFQR